MANVGSWYSDGFCVYVVVNRGGTVEKHHCVKWWKRAYLEILECINKPMGLAEIREYLT